MKSPAKSFQDLLIWKKTYQFVLSIYGLSKKFSDSEIYGSTFQDDKGGLSPSKLRLPALRFAIVLSSGILACRLFPHSRLFLLLFLILSAILYLIFRSRRVGKIFAQLSLYFLVAAAGFLLLLFQNQLRQHLGSGLPAPGDRVAILGHLTGPPWEERSYSFLERVRFPFQVEAQKKATNSSWERVSYSLIVSAPADSGTVLGGDERLALLARLRRVRGYANPEGFDYREYLAGLSISGEAFVEAPEDMHRLEGSATLSSDLFNPQQWAYRLRAKIFGFHEKLYPDQEASAVASALLIGTREQVPSQVREDFTLSGTVHVLVISGLHVGFIAVPLYLFFSLLLGRGLTASLFSLAGVFLFALVSGARPSVMRAAVMCSFALLALPLQRKRALLNSLAAAFAVLLLYRPDWLFDIGFQLSFTAVTGIGLLTPLLETRFRYRKWWSNPFKRYFVQLILASFSAQLAITPLVAYYFFRVTPSAFIANLIIIPLACFSVVTGFIADLAAFLFFPLARWISVMTAVSLKIMIASASFFSGIPRASIEVSPPDFFDIACFWIVLFLGAELFSVSGGPKMGKIIVVSLVWINYHIWGGVLALTREDMLVRFLDLGPGSNVAVLHLSDGKTVLVDPAQRGRGSLSVMKRVLVPYLTRYSKRNIDWLILRGTEPGEIRWAWDMIDNLRTEALILPSAKTRNTLYLQFLEYCQDKKITVIFAAAGDTLISGLTKIYYFKPGECVKEISNPDNKYYFPLLPVVEHCGRRLILSGKLSAAELKKILACDFDLKCRALEWPEALFHSPNENLAGEFLNLFQPAVVIVPSLPDGADKGRLGAFERKQAEEVRWLETAVTGAVEMRFEKEGLLFQSEREESFSEEYN